MSYCIKCGLEADICYCDTAKITLDEYQHTVKECHDLKCYCKKHAPSNQIVEN